AREIGDIAGLVAGDGPTRSSRSRRSHASLRASHANPSSRRARATLKSLRFRSVVCILASIRLNREYVKGKPMSFEPLTPERRRAMTRQHLLDAAAIVFARDGFHGATLDEVATAAGFSKGAVYSNFKSKEDLFLALFDERIDRQFAVVSEAL